MGDFYVGPVRKLVPPEDVEIAAKYPNGVRDTRICSSKTQPNWISGKFWTCTRPAHHDGPHVAYDGQRALAIWGSAKPAERPQWFITSIAGQPLVEESRRR
jgi:hypothetical protein